jgi:exodeoxyribonuclease V alpha subunit
MTQMSGRKSLTIASFVRETKPEELPDGVWIIIDEASMCDVLSFHRVISKLPSDSNLVLVGDDYQLPPVGPGLILHALVNNIRIPQTRLRVVKRQSDESGIPIISASIRKGVWPELNSDLNSGVSFIPCDPNELSNLSVEVLQRLGPSNSQIISATKGGNGGCSQLNRLCQTLLNNNNRFIKYYDEEYGEIEFLNNISGFKINDPVLFKRNDYKRGLRNGSLGIIRDSYLVKGTEDPVCRVEFDTGIIDLDSTDLSDLELAYAVTIHKSQGSQFDNVIVPIRNTRLLDLTLLYTAVTRAVQRVVLIGDEMAAKKAITVISANQRITGLSGFL